MHRRVKLLQLSGCGATERETHLMFGKFRQAWLRLECWGLEMLTSPARLVHSL